MHMCTYTPPDPEIILSMEITEKTYDHYLMLPAKIHHDKETVIGSYIIVPVDQPLSWAWVDKDYFDEFIEPIEDWLDGRYTLCKSKNKK